MSRLALAIAAALFLHYLLLMIVVPEPRIEAPDVRGSGQVTVSFIRTVQQEEAPDPEKVPVMEAVEEIAREPEKKNIEIPEEKDQEPPEAEEIQQPIIRKEEKANVTEKKARPKKPVIASRNRNVEKSEKKSSVQPKKVNTSQFYSDMQSLQDPQPISNRNQPPEYPTLARKRGWEGTVILEVDIRSDGVVKDILVEKSSGFKMLDKEALRAVANWYFRPGTQAGRPVAMKVMVPVHFTLTEQ